MDNLMVKEFNGRQVHTFMWKGKPCWIAGEIVSMFGYAETSVTIQDCIEAEDFGGGIEYDILRNEDLKSFKKLASEVTNKNLVPSIKFASQLTILYEDGVYGFLEYTHKPEGVQFRKWLRREVLPEIRKTGAFITDKADPKMLRAKADKIESLTSVNNAAKIILPMLEKAGMKEEYQLLTMQSLYRKAGVDLTLPALETDREIFDQTAIAERLEVYSMAGNPHSQAIGVIINQLDILPEEKILTSFERNGHTGTNEQYTSSVITKISEWLEQKGRPTEISGINGKKYNVKYGS